MQLPWISRIYTYSNNLLAKHQLIVLQEVTLCFASCSSKPFVVPSWTNISANWICCEETLFKSWKVTFLILNPCHNCSDSNSAGISPVPLFCFQFYFAALNSTICQNSCIQRHIHLFSPSHGSQPLDGTGWTCHRSSIKEILKKHFNFS